MRLAKQIVSAHKRLVLVALFLILMGCTPKRQEPLTLTNDIFHQSLPLTEATLLYSEEIDRANDKDIPHYTTQGLIGTNLSDPSFIAQHKDLMIKQGWKILSYTVSGYPIYCKSDYEHVLVRMINGLAFLELSAPQEVIDKAKRDYRSYFLLDVNYFPSTIYTNECK